MVDVGFFDGKSRHRKPGQELGRRLGDPWAGDLHDGPGPGVFHDPPDGGQVCRGDLPVEDDPDELVGGVFLHQAGEGAVIKEAAPFDDHDPEAKLDHVGHVVAGEQDGGLGAAVVFPDELADFFLHDDVQAQSRLVEQEQGGPVEQSRRQLRAHALSQGEFLDRNRQAVPQIQERDQLVEAAVEFRVPQAVDGLVEAKGLQGRDLPP